MQSTAALGHAPAAQSVAVTGLALDARGAILVPAIVMGALLVGGLFYVAAAGDAIIHRTQLQDAADTTAFTSAVWHAKGMNIVAVFNVVMSILLSVIVLFHVVEIICLLAALFPPFAPVALNLVSNLFRLESNISKGVNIGLEVLSATQKVTAIATPYIAAISAKATKTTADTIWPASMTLIPTPADKLLGQEETRFTGPAALPAQEDDFGPLCARATLVIPNMIVGMIDRVTEGAPWPIPDLAKDVVVERWNEASSHIEKFTEAGEGILCQPVNAILVKLGGLVANFAQNALTGSSCGNAAEEESRTQAERDADTAARAEGRPLPQRTPDSRGARDRRNRQADQCAGQLAEGLAKKTAFEVKPAIVWTAATNGNVFMHVWSRAQTTPHFFSTDQRLIGLADRGRAPTVTPSDVAYAEAEFYCDCADTWTNCQGDALWAPNWTARLRRFRWPQEELFKIGKDTLFNAGNVLEEVAYEQGEELISAAFRRHDFAGDVVAAYVMEKVQSSEVLKPFVDKINQAVAQGVESSGLGELLKKLEPKNERIH